MPSSTTLRAIAALALSTLAVAHSSGSESVPFKPQGNWFHDDNAPVNQMFKRQTNPALTIGSPEWVAQYPSATGVPSPAPADIPAAWLAAYNASKNAGHIPSIPVSTLSPAGVPTYPPGVVPTDPSVCTATFKCRAPGDIWDAPDGMIGISFDDGPIAIGPTLYAFLQQNHIPATHFMIGRVILGDLNIFNIAYGTNMDSIAVHTWSHPMMTTQTDLQQVVEIGWTMQIIHDLTGGRVPRFWRPPLGDCDMRCRAIASNVFNLTTVMWNQDTEDWRLSTNGTTGAWVAGNLTQWLTGPKSPGLIILEHELTADTVGFFMNTTWPLAMQHGWQPHNIPDLFALPWYQNSPNDAGAPTASLPIALPVAVASTANSIGASGTVVGSGTTGSEGGGAGGAVPAGGNGSSGTTGSGSSGSSGSSAASPSTTGAAGKVVAGALTAVFGVAAGAALLL